MVQRPAIIAEGLSKIYPSGALALSEVDLKVRGGEITTLLGRNGAGKTTFVKIAATLLRPTGGRMEVLSCDALKDPYCVRKKIALMPQEGYPLTFPKPGELIEAYLMMRGWGIVDAKMRTRRIMDETGIWEHRKKLVSQLSGGLKRKVLLAMILASGAELLFLDEPTLGLDPHSRRGVWRILEDARRAGQTILLTTHHMEEAEALSDKIVLLERGRVVIEGDVNSIISTIGATHRVEVDATSVDPSELAGYGRLYRHGSKFVLYADRESAVEAAERLMRIDVRVRVREVGLEDAFLMLAGGMKAL